jgi:hypothetical protein
MVTDTRSPDDHTYIIDPSFEKYENMNDLDDYWFFETSDALAFKEAKETDVFFSIDHGTPVFIKKDFLVTLTVEKVDNKCDRKNFALTLQATRRYKYSGRYLFALRIHEGKLEKFENEFLAKQVLGDNETEYVELRSQMLRWFEGIYRDSQK